MRGVNRGDQVTATAEVSLELTTREARTAAAMRLRRDELETAAGPPRDTFRDVDFQQLGGGL